MLCFFEQNVLLSILPMSLNDELTQRYDREGFAGTAECLRENADKGAGWTCLLSLHANHLDVIDQILGSAAADPADRLAAFADEHDLAAGELPSVWRLFDDRGAGSSRCHCADTLEQHGLVR